MEQAYAQALWRMVEGGMTPHKAVSALQESLFRHGRVALLPRIARAFTRIAERNATMNDVVLTVARESDERHARTAAKAALRGLGADAADVGELEGLKTQVDDSIIGGWRLEGRGVLVDNSHKSTLLRIYNRVTSA